MSGVKWKRLNKGKGRVGPDWYGCSNTGTAPAILHSRCGRYFVGPEVAVFGDAALLWHKGDQRKRSVTVYGYKVRVFKCGTSARKAFRALCDSAEERNANIREHHKADLKAAQQPWTTEGMEAAARLNDY